MPKIIELTVEIDVHKVSCPGVWLCQDGRVSLMVCALGTTYQTCLLPPVFPLMFKDVFYFRKRFQDTCSLNNVCCFLKDETIYCELMQWSKECVSGSCVLLAHYLGSLSDVLFPPNLCSNDGVDLLMRRTKEFPGILSPKIEITTKVRIDQLCSPQNGTLSPSKPPPCTCPGEDTTKQNRQVCHSAQYHRIKCAAHDKRSSSRSRSAGTPSSSSLSHDYCRCPIKPTSHCSRSPRKSPAYSVFTVGAPDLPDMWRDVTRNGESEVFDGDSRRFPETISKEDITPIVSHDSYEDRNRVLLESRYVDPEPPSECPRNKRMRIAPCVCEICKRYHELFHAGKNSSI